MNVLLIGSGGREHALAWKIAGSRECRRLYIAPGNPGTSMHGENVALDVKNHNQVISFIRDHGINMLVCGPEDPLVNGLMDAIASEADLGHVWRIGPEAKGARLEGSKDFAKEFMTRHGIPTASYKSFTKDQLESGLEFLKEMKPPYVLKADGLAAGKGVVICPTYAEASDTLVKMLENGLFGAASEMVVIEEYLNGIECSVFALTDGKNYVMFPTAKDYKRIGEGDTGPNTGGMGAVSPVSFADGDFMHKVEEKIVKPTIAGLSEDGIAYCGFIFFGLMNVKGEPYVIEYNVRLGDPETQAILPRVESDLLVLFRAAARGELNRHQIRISQDASVAVVLASGGYPGEYTVGFEIEGPVELPGSRMFYAGVAQGPDGLLTNGGRVLAINAMAADVKQALANAEKHIRVVRFMGQYHRKDIGMDLSD